MYFIIQWLILDYRWKIKKRWQYNIWYFIFYANNKLFAARLTRTCVIEFKTILLYFNTLEKDQKIMFCEWIMFVTSRIKTLRNRNNAWFFFFSWQIGRRLIGETEQTKYVVRTQYRIKYSPVRLFGNSAGPTGCKR